MQGMMGQGIANVLMSQCKMPGNGTTEALEGASHNAASAGLGLRCLAIWCCLLDLPKDELEHFGCKSAECKLSTLVRWHEGARLRTDVLIGLRTGFDPCGVMALCEFLALLGGYLSGYSGEENGMWAMHRDSNAAATSTASCPNTHLCWRSIFAPTMTQGMVFWPLNSVILS